MSAVKRPVPASAASFLAFDFGTLKVGVAQGSRFLAQGQALRTISTQGDARFAAIASLIKEWQPDALVVGVPCHPDGAPHAMTAHAMRFARQLQGRYGLPVFTVDERYSTTEALESGEKDIDAASACIILNQFLRGLST